MQGRTNCEAHSLVDRNRLNHVTNQLAIVTWHHHFVFLESVRLFRPVDACRLYGSNAAVLATISDRANIAEFLFQRQVPALTKCTLTVESRDDKPIKIMSLTTSRRTANLVPNAVQARPCVVTGGSVLC